MPASGYLLKHIINIFDNDNVAVLILYYIFDTISEQRLRTVDSKNYSKVIENVFLGTVFQNRSTHLQEICQFAVF